MSKSKRFDFKVIKDHAKDLRNNQTDSERLLWEELRSRKLSGYKFLRQHPILYKGNLLKYNYFIADFYCYEKKAVIELDGPVHDNNEEYDTYKDIELQEIGLRILRIKNEDLKDIPKVLKRIESFLNRIY
jgi:very-short-patch-repair endonuclease